jgi:hypothetical protein
MAKNRGRNKIKGKIVEKHVKKLGDVQTTFNNEQMMEIKQREFIRKIQTIAITLVKLIAEETRKST